MGNALQDHFIVYQTILRLKNPSIFSQAKCLSIFAHVFDKKLKHARYVCP